MDSIKARQIVDEVFAPPWIHERPWHLVPPSEELRNSYDLAYWDDAEGRSLLTNVRTVEAPADDIRGLVQSATVPQLLFDSALRLIGDGLVANGDRVGEKASRFRYLPPALISAVAAFEALLRLNCELLVRVAEQLPPAVRLALLESEEAVREDGSVFERQRSRPLQDRLWLLLKYGFGIAMNRGDREWQRLGSVLAMRNAIVHYGVKECPSLRASEVLGAIENLLLVLVAASARARRTFWLLQYEEHHIVRALQAAQVTIGDFEEAAPTKGWTHFGRIGIPCPFTNIDGVRYPQSNGSPPMLSIRRRGTS